MPGQVEEVQVVVHRQHRLWMDDWMSGGRDVIMYDGVEAVALRMKPHDHGHAPARASRA